MDPLRFQNRVHSKNVGIMDTLNYSPNEWLYDGFLKRKTLGVVIFWHNQILSHWARSVSELTVIWIPASFITLPFLYIFILGFWLCRERVLRFAVYGFYGDRRKKEKRNYAVQCMTVLQIYRTHFSIHSCILLCLFLFLIFVYEKAYTTFIIPSILPCFIFVENIIHIWSEIHNILLLSCCFNPSFSIQLSRFHIYNNVSFLITFDQISLCRRRPPV